MFPAELAELKQKEQDYYDEITLAFGAWCELTLHLKESWVELDRDMFHVIHELTVVAR